ncbi:tRNA (N6-threonylcarbamoyladenosine(37)-N6)-methyltransferase TrmO [Rhizobiaceae bacterium n13]|uniref:tRNA (N6-threonylcarbamoyladenosine(37)-N6)-methyltransferase TrmO n=1 Tax=Ferirhizobium litorale TaxID=2927786 RepID=A0AAE3U0V6_9HYPH|nr:tRNA (N6-threonylcarbamoyladenosine(37)-N6)-methyltransferase TrmO [Fererhizobium litorale]MDI7862247.1 tRNA (N6-threonylcarbamoyladenosine(37)-N6)-methyltransferase TrmO [Fererhizobium litorale]MDI7922479.1 tRNA (N6-threonylcarbamoyladenosine(37)-N6)-methyltransferase TrmO [Fererhizobium litorale]
MVRENDIRENEVAVDTPEPVDARLTYIGRISTPWTSRLTCPRQERLDGPTCRIEVFEPWTQTLKGIEEFERLEVIYWLDRSRRDLVLQSPGNNGAVLGTFSIRSPVRPNPIGTSNVQLESVDGNVLAVRGLDCLDGTPLLDLKPDRNLFKPIAPPQPGDFETGDAHMVVRHCQKK